RRSHRPTTPRLQSIDRHAPEHAPSTARPGAAQPDSTVRTTGQRVGSSQGLNRMRQVSPPAGDEVTRSAQFVVDGSCVPTGGRLPAPGAEAAVDPNTGLMVC